MIPTIGRCVHYVLKSGRGIRAATVVNVTDAGGPFVRVNLQVLTDGANDRSDSEVVSSGSKEPTPSSFWVADVSYHDEVESKLGSWHWPPRV